MYHEHLQNPACYWIILNAPIQIEHLILINNLIPKIELNQNEMRLKYLITPHLSIDLFNTLFISQEI